MQIFISGQCDEATNQQLKEAKKNYKFMKLKQHYKGVKEEITRNKNMIWQNYRWQHKQCEKRNL